MTHLKMAAPGMKCSEPLKSGVVWVAKEQPSADWGKDIKSMTQEQFDALDKSDECAPLPGGAKQNDSMEVLMTCASTGFTKLIKYENSGDRRFGGAPSPRCVLRCAQWQTCRLQSFGTV